MLRVILASFSLFFSTVALSQTFNATVNGVIPDNNTQSCFPISVSGLPAVLDTSFGLIESCVNINHTWDADISIQLMSPNGIMTTLSYNNGGSGDNYTNTCFRMDASTSITNGSAPFSGSFLPQQSINAFNIGLNPNGTWMLCVIDQVPSDTGRVVSFSLTFGPNPPTDPSLPGNSCSTIDATGCLCPDGTQNCDLLPDMTSSELIIQQQHTEYTGYLTMSNATPNIGWGPLEIHGINSCFCDTVPVSCSVVQCPDGSYPNQLVEQTIYHKNNGTISTYNRAAGTMSYHPSHGHTHVDHWADFSLRVKTSDPDATTWPIVGTGSKVSFCLINLGDCSNDYGYCEDTAGNILTVSDIPNYPMGSVSGCGTDQGIYAGNLDIYSQGMPGMQVDFPNICNGDYYIVSITDPNNNFLESNENNNWAAVPITLTDQLIPSGTVSFGYSISGLHVTFSNTTPLTDGFLWDFGDGTTDTTKNPTHVYAASGIYPVKLMAINHCFNPLSLTLSVNNVGVSESSIPSFGLSVYPNPGNDNSVLKYYLPNRMKVTIDIYDLTSNFISRVSEMMNEQGGHSINLGKNMSHLPKGSYLIKLTTETKTEIIKFSKL